MIVESISTLTPVSHRAIIINVSTKQVTTLALMSVLRHSQLPILLIDKQSTDGSWEHFSQLAASEPRLDLCSMPMELHPQTLDKIFKATKDENLLLIDADLEILDPGVVARLLEANAAENVFGAGAIHGPEWLGSSHKMRWTTLPEKAVLYIERMWTPFSILKVRYIQEAFAEGYSFISRWVPNDIPSIPLLSKALAFRLFLPVIKNVRAEGIRSERYCYQNERPSLVHCDTGADIFCHLKYDRGLQFVDFGIANLEKMAHHYHGVTRRRLNPHDRNAAAIDDVMPQVLKRLQQEYGIEL